jgi:quinol monooxygenase YgiN
MIVGTVRILPPPGRRADVLEVLRSVQSPVRAQPGCVACDIYEEHGPEAAIVFIERFESDEALNEHLRSDTYRRILGAIDLSGVSSDVRFDRVSFSEGIELIHRAREPIGTGS